MQFQVNIPPETLAAAVAEELRKLQHRTKVPKLSYKLKDAAAATGMSVAWFRREIRKKKIKTVKLGHTILIPAPELHRLLTDQAPAKAKGNEEWSTNEEIFGGLSSSSMVN
ncbi:MAG: helix-turn-helix domain-containing protein [Blastocatellia bacterium]